MGSVNKLTVEYTQDADSVHADSDQFLEVSTEDAGSGVYYVIKTDRWAFDNVSELIRLLKDFEQRLDHNSDDFRISY